MTTETLTTPSIESTAATPAVGSNTYSVVGLVLSILSIPTGMGPLAIAGVILGFIGRGKEPAAVTTANWAIVIGLLSLFGWIILAVIGFVMFAPFALGAWAADSFWFGSFGF
jgi:fatty acid desaturase